MFFNHWLTIPDSKRIQYLETTNNLIKLGCSTKGCFFYKGFTRHLYNLQCVYVMGLHLHLMTQVNSKEGVLHDRAIKGSIMYGKRVGPTSKLTWSR